MVWTQYIKPRYYDQVHKHVGGRFIALDHYRASGLLLCITLFQGVNAYWLDETDGEGTAGGDVPGKDCDMRIEDCGGYQTSFGPAVAYSNLWVNQWLGMYTDPVAKVRSYFLVFVPTIREIRDFYREM
eukprot:SAG31_NODE_574_length_13967_cov_7.512042_6_plen_128_part_00